MMQNCLISAKDDSLTWRDRYKLERTGFGKLDLKCDEMVPKGSGCAQANASSQTRTSKAKAQPHTTATKYSERTTSSHRQGGRGVMVIPVVLLLSVLNLSPYSRGSMLSWAYRSDCRFSTG